MHPIHLHGYFFPKGSRLWTTQEIEESRKNDGMIHCFITDYIESIREAAAFYLPEFPDIQKDISYELEPEENGNLDELKIVAGLATTEIFLIADVSGADDFSKSYREHPDWMHESLREGSYADVQEATPEIYKDILRLCIKDPEPDPNSKGRIILPQRSPEHLYDPNKPEVYPFYCLTMWKAITSHDWESGIDELEGFSYGGPGVTILKKDWEKLAKALPWWQVSGIRHSCHVRAHSAADAIEKAHEAKRVDKSWEKPEATLIGPNPEIL